MWIVFSVFLVSSVYTTDDQDFGECKPLAEPIGSDPLGGNVRAGSLSVVKEGSEIVVRAFCDETQGFVPANGSFPEMRCSWNEDYKEWTWNHFHRQSFAPAIRCARISPKPILQKYSFGPNFTACDGEEGKQEFEGLVRDYLTMLPCVEQKECIITKVFCLGKTFSVIVKPSSLHPIEKQKRLLESSATFLKNVLPASLLDKESHKRRKRFIFDNIVPDNTESSDCVAGEVVDGDNCKTCTAGFFANQTTPACEACALDEYSIAAVNECTACGTGKGTLNVRSSSQDECIDICTVPPVEFINNVLDDRVAEDSTVYIYCQDGYAYGNATRANIICSGSGANFPASCRKLSVSVESSAIKSGDDAVLTCSIEATDVGQGIVWSMGETALSNSGGDYAIATTLGTAVEADLRTIISTSTLTINAFDAADVASYSCAVDYALPILDDSSVYLSISILVCAVIDCDRLEDHCVPVYNDNQCCPICGDSTKVCNLKSEIENGRAVSEHGSGKDFQYIFECDSGYWFQDGNAAYCNKDGEAVYPICQKMNIFTKLVESKNKGMFMVKVMMELGNRTSKWGLLCDDGFKDVEADIICKSNGYKYGRAASLTKQEEEQFMLTMFSCTKDSLQSCSANHYDTAFLPCQNDEVAGTICFNAPFEYISSNLEVKVKKRWINVKMQISAFKYGAAVNLKKSAFQLNLDNVLLLSNVNKMKPANIKISGRDDVAYIKMKAARPKKIIQAAEECFHVKVLGPSIEFDHETKSYCFPA